MKENINVNVHHLTRVEGHGNIVVDVNNGVIEKCQWQVPEAPRFFEAMVRGRHYSEVARIVSRICGICSVGHSLAAVRATESALGMQVSPQTEKLRTILKLSENFDSHVLHVYLLAAPDLLNSPSAFAILPEHADVVACALRLKRLGHEWGSMIAGRTTHPTTLLPGGFASVPTTEELRGMRDHVAAAMPDLEATIETIKALAPEIPDFNRPTEYMAVSKSKEYGLFDGYIETVLPDGDRAVYGVGDYRKCTNEYVVPQSTAKYTKNRMDSYAVGALARFNVNYDKLCPEAQEVAQTLGISPLCTNPFYNTVAQVVEMVHSVYQGLQLMDELIEEGVHDEAPVQPVMFDRGASATEVPRGILFHEYEYDEDGMCKKGNCVIPTNQNHANIQADFDALLPQMLEQNKSADEIKLAMEMLVRAYDPCISCSTHCVDVSFR